MTAGPPSAVGLARSENPLRPSWPFRTCFETTVEWVRPAENPCWASVRVAAVRRMTSRQATERPCAIASIVRQRLLAIGRRFWTNRDGIVGRENIPLILIGLSSLLIIIRDQQILSRTLLSPKQRPAWHRRFDRKTNPWWYAVLLSALTSRQFCPLKGEAKGHAGDVEAPVLGAPRQRRRSIRTVLKRRHDGL